MEAFKEIIFAISGSSWQNWFTMTQDKKYLFLLEESFSLVDEHLLILAPHSIFATNTDKNRKHM